MSSVAAFERAMSYGNYQRALLIAWRTLHRKPGDVTNGMAAFLLEYLPARLDGDALEAAIAVLSQDFRFGSFDGTSLHPHPAKRNHFSTRKRRRLRPDRSSPLLAPHGG